MESKTLKILSLVQKVNSQKESKDDFLKILITEISIESDIEFIMAVFPVILGLIVKQLEQSAVDVDSENYAYVKYLNLFCVLMNKGNIFGDNLVKCKEIVQPQLKIFSRILLCCGYFLEKVRENIMNKAGLETVNLNDAMIASLESSRLCAAAFSSVLYANNDPPKALSGPYLAQLLDVLLFFSGRLPFMDSKSYSIIGIDTKIICETSLLYLLELLVYRAVQSDAIWRTYFPGIYSCVHAVCVGKKISKNGSNSLNFSFSTKILSTALLVLIEISKIVLSGGGKLTIIQGVSENTEEVSVTDEWRADTLQRLSVSFPTAYMTVFANVSDKYRTCIFIRAILLMICCSDYVGEQGRKFGLDVLLQSIGSFSAMGTADDAYDSVDVMMNLTLRKLYAFDDCQSSRETIKNNIHLLREKGKSVCVELLNDIIDNCVECLMEVNNEITLKVNLQSILGCFVFLKDVLITLFVEKDDNISEISIGRKLMFLLVRLLAPNDFPESLLLENKEFFIHNKKIPLGYYRPNWQYFGTNVELKSLVRMLCFHWGASKFRAPLNMLIEFNERSVSSVRKELRKFFRSNEKIEDAEGVGSKDQELSKSKRVDVLKQAYGAIRCLTYALLGCCPVKKFTRLPLQKQHLHCEYCSIYGVFKEGGTPESTSNELQLLRCVRCKNSYYCSSAHQKLHWSIHKLNCKPCSFPSKIPSSSCSISDSTRDSLLHMIHGNISIDPDIMCDDLSNLTNNLEENFDLNDFSLVIDKILALSESIFSLYTACQAEEMMGKNINDEDSDNIIFFGNEKLLAQERFSPTLNKKDLAYVELILSSCLELLCSCAFVLRKRFREKLMSIVYQILLFSVDSKSIVVFKAGQSSLVRISAYCGYDNVGELIRYNMDYITNELCLVLSNNLSGDDSDHNPVFTNSLFLSNNTTRKAKRSRMYYGSSAPLVLSAMFDALTELEGNLDVPLMLLQDIIIYVLQSVDSIAASGMLNNTQIKPLLESFRVLTKSVIKFKGTTKVKKPFRSVFSPQESKEIDDIEDELDDMDIDTLKKLNPAYNLLWDILDRCKYFISSDAMEIQVLVIDIITMCISGYADCRKLLLPSVHQIFSPIMKRMSELSKIVHFHYKLMKIEDLSTMVVQSYKGVSLEDSVVLSKINCYLPNLLSAFVKGARATSDLNTKLRSADKSLLLLEEHHATKNSNVELLSSSIGYFKSNSEQRVLKFKLEELHSEQKHKLHTLPVILKCISQMAYLTNDFMNIKFTEEIWPCLLPEIATLSCNYLQQLDQLAQLESKLQYQHSLFNRLVKGVFQFILDLTSSHAVLENNRRHLQQVYQQLIVLIIPFLIPLNSNEQSENNIQDLAGKVVSALKKFNENYVQNLINAVENSNGGGICEIVNDETAILMFNALRLSDEPVLSISSTEKKVVTTVICSKLKEIPENLKETICK